MPMPRKDLTGQRFGRLTAIEIAGKDARGCMMWRFRCDCGKEVVARGTSVTGGDQKSCGCLRAELLAEHNKPKHGGTKTRLYNIWRGMKKRCYVPSAHAYDKYGGRGITVCDEWKNDFGAFHDWALTHGYREDLTLDRKDNDKGYSPENCRWATWLLQGNNKRRFKNKPEAQEKIALELQKLEREVEA